MKRLLTLLLCTVISCSFIFTACSNNNESGSEKDASSVESNKEKEDDKKNNKEENEADDETKTPDVSPEDAAWEEYKDVPFMEVLEGAELAFLQEADEIKNYTVIYNEGWDNSDELSEDDLSDGKLAYTYSLGCVHTTDGESTSLITRFFMELDPETNLLTFKGYKSEDGKDFYESNSEDGLDDIEQIIEMYEEALEIDEDELMEEKRRKQEDENEVAEKINDFKERIDDLIDVSEYRLNSYSDSLSYNLFARYGENTNIDFKVTLDGETFSFPTSYAQTVAGNWVAEVDGDYKIKLRTKVEYLNDENHKLYFSFDTDSEKALSECEIIGVQLASLTTAPDFDICGITNNSTLEDIIQTIGKPFLIEYMPESNNICTLCFKQNAEDLSMLTRTDLQVEYNVASDSINSIILLCK